MNWRKLPLPLLMLSVALPAAEAARDLRPVAGQVTVRAQEGLALVSRRRSESAEPVQASEQSLLSVAEYLRCLSSGRQPDDALCLVWDEFHAWCDGLIRRYAGALGLRDADVDDCTQEVWVDLLQKMPDFRLDRSRGSFGSWLYRVVQHKAADLRRRQARRPAGSLTAETSLHLADSDPGPAEASLNDEQRHAVRRILDELRRSASPDSYQVLHLRQLEGRSVPEVAEQLGLTPQQVWAREHRMKRKLEELLRAQGLGQVA